MIYLELYDITTGKTFKKTFDCEFDKQKFRRKLRFSKKIVYSWRKCVNNRNKLKIITTVYLQIDFDNI